MVDQKLISFLSIVKHSSYTKAARELSLTQPAISHHMRQLEEEYGHKMVTYEGRKLELTEAGRILHDHAVRASTEERTLINALSGLTLKRKELKFGATLTIGEFTIAPYLSELFRCFPEVHFSMLIDNTKNLMELLNSAELDFALIEGLFQKENYDATLLKTCDFILVTSGEHPLTKKKKVKLEDLLDEVLIIREKGSGSREILERGLYEKNRSLNSFREIIEMGNVNVMKKMTMEGIGISLMYKDAALKEIEEGLLKEVSVEDLKMEREFNFVQMDHKIISMEVQSIMRFFMERMG